MSLSRTVTVAITVLVGSTSFPQDQKPNFSGTWLLVAPAEAAVQPPGQEETITQTESAITFGHPSEGGGHRTTCTLDGQWRENSIAGMRFSCKATWEGRKLVVVEKDADGGSPTRRPGERTKILEIDENGSLVMEIKPPIPNFPGGPAKLVYRKR